MSHVWLSVHSGAMTISGISEQTGLEISPQSQPGGDENSETVQTENERLESNSGESTPQADQQPEAFWKNEKRTNEAHRRNVISPTEDCKGRFKLLYIVNFKLNP